MNNETLVNINFFRYEMRDIIRTVPNAVVGTGSTYANTGSQHGTGMELESRCSGGRDLQLTGNYSYQKSIDDTYAQDAGYAPHHHIYARADVRFAGNWQFSPQLNWVADRKRAYGDARNAMADYTTVDVTLRATSVWNNWDISSSIRNLFNSDAREPSLAPGTSFPNDLPMPGRSWWLQAIYSL